jgi:5-methylcytosine-specific restriction endonuclease McrA
MVVLVPEVVVVVDDDEEVVTEGGTACAQEANVTPIATTTTTTTTMAKGRIKIRGLERERVAFKTLYTCTKCGMTLAPGMWDVDHVVPVAEGGGNDLDNLQALCTTCHRRKSNAEQEARTQQRRAAKRARLQSEQEKLAEACRRAVIDAPESRFFGPPTAGPKLDQTGLFMSFLTLRMRDIITRMTSGVVAQEHAQAPTPVCTSAPEPALCAVSGADTR